MDGAETRLRDSLQFQLSAWLSSLVVLLALAAGAASFWSSFQEANELQDDQLRQVAALIDVHELSVPHGLDANPRATHDPELRVIVQMLEEPPAAPPSASTTAALAIPAGLPEGLQTVSISEDSWRLLIRSLRNGRRLAVGQQTEARDEIARNSALRTALPMLVLLPLLAVLVSLVVRQRLRPVAALSMALDQRTEHDATPLPTAGVPSEIRPFAASISRLLQRLAQAMDAQRRFVADAAHELRSPLTALSLQAESLAKADLNDDARAQVGRLREGVLRARQLIDQLLALARFQSQLRSSASPVSARQVLRRVLEDMVPVAEARDIDLGVIRQDDVLWPLQEVELHAVMRNLLDNAIRYSPPGSRVDISLERTNGAGTVLEVIDNGPGIPAAERARVFDAFYRVLGTDIDGSGLGLSIVKMLVDRAGGSVILADARGRGEEPGLRVTVSFPDAPMGQAR